MNITTGIEYKSFIWLLIFVSFAFIILMFPFLGIIFWSLVIAIIFSKIQDYFVKNTNSPNFSACITLLIAIIIVVLPFLFIGNEFFKQGLALYQGIESGKIDINQYINKIKYSFPFIKEWMDKLSINQEEIQAKLAEFAVFASKYIGQKAISIGKETINIIAQVGLLLYVAFFALRDKKQILFIIHQALPLGDKREALLFQKIADMTKATINGSLVIAIVQGTLGGIIFYCLDVQSPILWGGVMCVLSLIPMVGAGLIWVPVAIYFFATGNWQSGIILIIFGVTAIGLVDNILRPILVGRGTRLPDYLVLLSTLGGFALFGMNGFVIGPLIAVLFITCWDIFIREFNNEVDKSFSITN